MNDDGLTPAEKSQSPIRSWRMKFFTRIGASSAQETIGARPPVTLSYRRKKSAMSPWRPSCSERPQTPLLFREYSDRAHAAGLARPSFK